MEVEDYLSRPIKFILFKYLFEKVQHPSAMLFRFVLVLALSTARFLSKRLAGHMSVSVDPPAINLNK